MPRLLTIAAALFAILSGTVLSAATELQYSGSLTQLSRRGPSTAVKQFDVYVLITSTGSGQRCFYHVTERGGGGWAWPERFGQVLLNAESRRTAGRPAHILHTHDGTRYPVELAAPYFEFADRLGPDARWTAGKLSYEVAQQKKVANRDCWQINAADNFGRRQSFFVERDSSRLVAADRRVFMGRGDEFQLRMELTGSRTLDGEALERTTDTVDSLLALQSELDREAGEVKPELADDQLAKATATLKSLIDVSAETPLKNLVSTIARDVSTQSRRTEDVASLAKRFVGKAAPEFELTTLKKKTVSSKTQKGRISVLHFWEYNGDSIEEPYGQVGYLDFLLNRRGRLGVDVIGVAVDKRFGTPADSGAALRSVRKLREFMNLSYPVATDSGATLRKFGDPRELGATLPVWVVLGADGKIAHYHVGFYSIRPDEGLRELDAAVVKLVREQREASE